MIYLSNINLNQNELQNAVVQPLAAAPANPKLGQIYTDSVSKRIKMYDGTQWNVVGAIIEESETNGKIKVDGVDMTVYTLPKATEDILGGVKVGAGLQVDENGLLSTNIGTELEAKADKVVPVVAGNFAGLDSDGNLIDSGKKASDFEVAGAAEAVQGNTSETVASVNTKVENVKSLIGQEASGEEAATGLIKKIADNTQAITTKVDKVEGKGLSTEDYTTDDKNKLAGIATGAEVNVQADWDVTDTTSDAYILNKPTKLSDFTNDEEFIDKTISDLVNYYTKTEVYTKEEVNTKIGEIATINIVVPESGELPETGKTNEIYLIPKEGGANPNAYDEYLWTGSVFEKIGDTEIDLSNYLTKTGDASKTTVAFTSASERTAIATGEALDVIIGKIAKYLADLVDVAFSGSYSDLSDTPTLVKTQTIQMTAADGTQKIVNVVGEKILDVVLTDTVTHEMLQADVTINGLTATVKIASAYANGIDILVSYM